MDLSWGIYNVSVTRVAKRKFSTQVCSWCSSSLPSQVHHSGMPTTAPSTQLVRKACSSKIPSWKQCTSLACALQCSVSFHKEACRQIFNYPKVCATDLRCYIWRATFWLNNVHSSSPGSFWINFQCLVSLKLLNLAGEHSKDHKPVESIALGPTMPWTFSFLNLLSSQVWSYFNLS